MVRIYQTIRISNEASQTVEKFLKTKNAKKMGLQTICSTTNYALMKLLDENYTTTKKRIKKTNPKKLTILGISIPIITNIILFILKLRD